MEDNNTACGAAPRLTALALRCGAANAAVIDASLVVTEASFRKLCEANSCGNYGRNYACPPDCGEIDTLMAALKTYRFVLVYQTIGMLEDSFDVEGMGEAAKHHGKVARTLRGLLKDEPGLGRYLQLNAGGCRLCPVCAKRTNEPCRHPDLMLVSLEAYGVNVSLLAPAAGMKYINGQNTVTYFGAVFFDGTEARDA